MKVCVCVTDLLGKILKPNRSTGILFLTTNRISDFDDAFASRIHLHIKYQALTDQRRSTIWRNLLSPAISEAWGDETLIRLGETYDINGREIKNLIKTASAVANFQQVPMSKNHIAAVYKLNHDK